MANNESKAIKQSGKAVNIFHSLITAWIVLGVSLVLTIVAYKSSSHFVQQRAQDRFNYRVTEIENAIQERLRIYEQQLWSGVGFMYAADNVSRTGFKKFVETMAIDKNWLGIQGYGFSVPVRAEEKQSHIDSIRAEGFPDFTIKPEGIRDVYTSIIYLEPFDWRNQRAFGYDMWSNDMRREAMTRTRDEGKATTSGIITLVQETDENVQKGFLTYVPVYETENIPLTLKERQEQFTGWVYAAYRAGDLMKGILGAEDPDIEFEVFDGNEMTKDNLLFDSNATLHLEDERHNPVFEKIVKVVNQGRLWTLYFNASKGGAIVSDQMQPKFIFIGGVIVNILLFYVLYSMYFLQKKAMLIANNMTEELQLKSKELELRSEDLEKEKDSLENTVRKRTEELEHSKKSLEEEVSERTKELQTRIEEVERMNKAMVGRELKMKELKDELTKLKNRKNDNYENT